MADGPKFYWDACMWIALINRETGRFDSCRHIIELAQRKQVQIWTSTFTYAEVFKRKCADDATGIASADDKSFEDYLEQDFVNLIQVDADVGRAARRLLREYPKIAKPQDAIHVASALLQSVPLLHTFDRSDLIALSGQIKCLDGQTLKIEPPTPPPDPMAGTMFEGLTPAEPEKKAG